MGDRVRRLQREGAGWSVCVPRTNKENDNNRWLLEQQSNKKRAGPEDDDILAERRTEGKGRQAAACTEFCSVSFKETYAKRYGA